MIKRRIIKYGILFLVPYVVFLTLTAPGVTEVAQDYIFGAHRGDSEEFIENTLDAISAAVAKDEYKFIEFDVQFTGDLRPVVFHDGTLLRTQQKPYGINSLTYDELQEVSEYHIPLYNEVINVINGEKKINVEIKSSDDIEIDAGLVDYVVEHAENNGYLDDVMISSISADVVKYINEAYPDMKTGQVFLVSTSTYLGTDYLTNKIYEEVEETGADYIMLHGANMRNYDNLIELKPKGKTITMWYFTNEMYIIELDEGDGLW